MGTIVGGFSFSDSCLKCEKVMEHRVEVERKEFFGTCSSCGQSRLMTDLNQVFYPRTELWVTRFKIGNLASVVTGKLLDAGKHA
jgi:hypothetical protein